MRYCRSICAVVAAVVLTGFGAMPENTGTVRIASFKSVISPEVGAELCGYYANHKSVSKHDDLYAVGLCVDDGTNRILIVSLDLLGLDGDVTDGLRRRCAAELGIRPEAVLLTCTHTHSGPESCRRSNLPDSINQKYIDWLGTTLVESVRTLRTARWTECHVLFNSAIVDENYNRRYVAGDNTCTFITHRRELQSLCRGVADKELGLLLFYEKGRICPVDGPAFVLANYAAHPLAGHAPGVGGLRISADFPGFFRGYIETEVGSPAMFVQGAAGDLIPREDELGMEAVRRVGVNLAKAAVNAMIDAQRTPARFAVADPRVGASLVPFVSPLRQRFRGKIQPEYCASDDMHLKLQCVSIGDCAFLGTPGELTNEMGLEIKWHSPFRKTWIAYLATGYCGYISPANFMVQGGYEPTKQMFHSHDSLAFVTAAVEALGDLRTRIFPMDGTSGEPYPDCVDRPFVNMAVGVKYRSGLKPEKKEK